MNNGIFLSVKDLMRLTGSNSYEASRQTHQAIRDSLGNNKRKLTVREYCLSEQIDYEEVENFLNKPKIQ